jgi:hypothetical protein
MGYRHRHNLYMDAAICMQEDVSKLFFEKLNQLMQCNQFISEVDDVREVKLDAETIVACIDCCSCRLETVVEVEIISNRSGRSWSKDVTSRALRKNALFNIVLQLGMTSQIVRRTFGRIYSCIQTVRVNNAVSSQFLM